MDCYHGRLMDWFEQLPTWTLALVIFGLRIVDVSLGTIRTIAVVNGRLLMSVAFGFMEVMVWVIAVSQVITRLEESPLLLLAFAAGYAAGNGAGVCLDRWLAMGTCVLRFISMDRGDQVAEALRRLDQRVTTFEGRGRDGRRVMAYISCRRRSVERLVEAAREVDPAIYFDVEYGVAARLPMPPTPGPGLRSLVWRRKAEGG